MTTPMNLQYPIPGAGGTTGPLWAQMVNTNFGLIESHDHTSGKGEPIVAAAVNIDGDLSFNSHNAKELRSARLINYASAGIFAAATADKSCIFSVGGELYYRDQAGNSVQITSAGGVAGTPGSIGSLVAPAAVSWGALAGNLAFFADTGANTGMNLVAGGMSFADPAAGGMAGNLINVKAPSSPSTYTITLPAAGPATNQTLTFDSSGNASFSGIGQLPIGSVIATFPNLTGAYDCTATTAADAAGFVKCGGQVIADAASPMNGQTVPNINNDVFLAGHATSGTAGGANSLDLAHTHSLSVSGSVTMPAHYHDLNSYGGARIFLDYTNGNIWSEQNVGQTQGNGPAATLNPWYLRATGAAQTVNATRNTTALSGRTDNITGAAPTVGFTSSGTSGSALSSPQDIRPKYITARFIMRIK